MKVRIGAALVAALLVAADPMGDPKKEKDKLKGTWVVQSFEAGGMPIDSLKGMTFAFDGDKSTSQVPNQKASPGTYKLNATKKLKEIDLVVNHPGGGRTTTRAIYTCTGDELKIFAAATKLEIDAGGRVVEKIGARPKATDGKAGATITLTRAKK
jgi:uncharacterized protein (TIGR03067 family)